MEKAKIIKILTAIGKIAQKGAKEKLEHPDGKSLLNYGYVYLDGQIIRAYNGKDQWLTAELTCDISTPVVVEYASLRQACQTMVGNIELSYDEMLESVLVNGVIRVKAIEIGDCFKHPAGFTDDVRQLPDNFYSLYKEVQKHTSKDPLRPAMTGVYLNGERNELAAVDGLTLCLHPIDYEGANIIIPTIPTELGKNLQLVKLDEENQYEISGDDFTFSFKQTDYRFPLYPAVMPQDENLTEIATVNADELITICEQAKIVNGFGAFTFDDTTLNVRAENIDLGTEYTNSIPCELDGFGITIGFNFELLIKILKQCKGDDVRICMSDPKRPVVIKSNKHNFYLLIMPVMLNV